MTITLEEMCNFWEKLNLNFLELPEFQPHFREGDKQDDALEWAELSLVGEEEEGRVGTVYWLWDQKREDSIWPNGEAADAVCTKSYERFS